MESPWVEEEYHGNSRTIIREDSTKIKAQGLHKLIAKMFRYEGV